MADSPQTGRASRRCTQWHSACFVHCESSPAPGRVGDGERKYPSSGTVAAEPGPIDLDWSTTALAHHRHAARLPGARRLRRDARQRRLAAGARGRADAPRCWTPRATAGMLVIHTREGHLPDLSDAPPAKIERGAPSMRIGDPGPMGRILIRGEAGHDIIPALYPLDGEIVIDKPGKGAFYATDLGDVLQNARHREPARVRRHHRGLRQHHRARGQRPRLSLRRAGRLLRLVLPRIPRDGPEDDQGPGRHLRLGQRLGRGSRRRWHRRLPTMQQREASR